MTCIHGGESKGDAARLGIVGRNGQETERI